MATSHNSGCTAIIVLIEPIEPDNRYPDLIQDDCNHNQRCYNVICCNVGDSRCFITEKDHVVFSTTDHKPQNAIEHARIRNAGGKVSEGRVDGNLAISRAIGDREYKMNSKLKAYEQKVIPAPTITSYIAESKNNRMIICCDGLLEKQCNQSLAKVLDDPKISLNGSMEIMIQHKLPYDSCNIV